MATYVYEDFRVTFLPGTDGGYLVHAVDVDGRITTSTFNVPMSADDLERAVLRLAHNGTTRRANPTTTRDVGGTDDRPVIDAERLGASLADALLGGDVGAAYHAARRRAEAGGHGVRLTLSLAGAPALLSVPWEFLYERPRFLASQRRTPVVRLLDTGTLTTPPVVEGAVRILGIVASPRDLAPLDVAGERRRIEEALADVRAAGQVELDWLEPASPRSLRVALRDGHYHAIHYVGHSDFDAAGEGMIYLEDAETGRSLAVDETLFANLLSDQDQLRLVVLNSCEGARTTLTDPYAGVATTLVQLGVPAVIAMQFEISDRAAIVFAEELYTNLIARRDPIDAAVAEARKAVYADVDDVEWATPVLFVRDPEVELLRFGDPPPAPAPPDPAAAPATPAAAVPRPDAVRWQRIVRNAVAFCAVLLLTVLVVRACAGGDDDTATSTTPTTAPPALGFPTVQVGDEGLLVQELQRLLGTHGHDVPVTGFFDDATEDAVRALEGEKNIPPDGVVGRVTWQQLTPPLRRGDSGQAVLAAEELLRASGAVLAPDDRFTNDTQAQVVAFQRTHGLPVDGIVDVDTWRVLLALAADRPATVVTVPPAATSVTTSAPAGTSAPVSGG